jgi:prophage tail gpP-like protein
MAARARDVVTIESVAGGGSSFLIDRATQYEIGTDLLSPSYARFELGDSTTWNAARRALQIGNRFSVAINGKPRVTGRLLTRNLAVSPSGGATVQLVVKTRLADAAFDACDPKIGVRNTTLRDVILAAFKRAGLTAADFIFEANVARDLITGRRSGQSDPVAGLRARRAKLAADADSVAKDVGLSELDEQISNAEGRPVDPALSTLREDEARPHPPETVYSFVDRHLARFGLTMWDGPDGRIVIGRPDDAQRPSYVMTCLRGAASATNNVISATKTEDFEQVPAEMWVYGTGGGRDQSKARVRTLLVDPTLYAVVPSLSRVAVVIDESLRTPELAAARARREMLRRSLQKDSWSIETDGLSYWTGTQRLAYGVDTVADVQIDVAGAAQGPYLIYQCTQSGNAESAHTTQFACVGKGVWVL